MGIKTKKHLTFIADVLEGGLKEVFSFGSWTARIVGANIMERKPRKPCVSRRQSRTRRIIYREAVYRQAAPRVVYIRAK
jgi:hypothetical protein